MQRVRSSATAALASLLLALWVSVPRTASFHHRHAGGDKAHVHLDGHLDADGAAPRAQRHPPHAVGPDSWEHEHSHDEGTAHDHDAVDNVVERFASDVAAGDDDAAASLSQVAAGGEHAHHQSIFLPALAAGAVAISERGAVLALPRVAPVLAAGRAVPATIARGPPSPSLV